MKISRVTTLGFLAFGCAIAIANEGAHGAEEGAIPVRTILIQLFNFTILIGILFYVLKDKIKLHFAKRVEAYQDLVGRAERAYSQALERKTDIESKLKKLDATTAESKKTAERESLELKKKILADAEGLSAHIEQEAKQAAVFEIENAKAELRAELVDIAFEAANATLKSQVGEPERKRLQSEFAEKIQVVR